MSQCYCVNPRLSNWKLNKLNSAIKNAMEVTLNLPSNVINNSNNGAGFPHELLFTDRQVSRVCRAFLNNWSTNIKISKTLLSKIVQSGRYLDQLIIPLLKARYS